MYYRIANLMLRSELRLPSFSAFSHDPAEADVVLAFSDESPVGGKDLEMGNLMVRRQPNGWFFQRTGGKRGGLVVSEDYSRLGLTGIDPALDELDVGTEWLVRIALECMLARRGYVSLHAAAVLVDGEAYAFTGPSGIGKSTRADAWQEAFGATLISGDRPLISVGSMELCGVPWDGKEQCFHNARYPLKTICDIRRSDRAYVRAMSYDQRRRLLMQQSFLPMWDTMTSAIQMANMVKLAKGAHIVRMFCGPLPEDAKNIRSGLERHDLKEEGSDLKAKNGFVLRNVMGDHILMPAGDNVGQFKGAVVLNDVAAFVWEKLRDPVSRDDLLLAICAKYDVDEAVAAGDLDALLERLKGYGVIEEE